MDLVEELELRIGIRKMTGDIDLSLSGFLVRGM